MAEQKVDLRRVRDFGACISDAFAFIRQNAGPLLKSFFAICAVFMLAQAIYNGIYQSRSVKLLSSVFYGRKLSFPYLMSMFGARYIILIVLDLLAFVSMQVTLGVYIKYYVENRQMPGIEQVWSLFRRYFFTICLYKVLTLAIIIAGAVFCVLPGIYLGIVLMPFSLIVIVEDKSFMAAFKRCFDLIRDNFWMSVAIYLVAYMIYSIGGAFIGLAVSMVGGLLTYLTTSEISTSLGVVTSFLNIFSLSFYMIFFICMALNYFSLVEMKDGVGLINRIDDIGSNPVASTDAGDQY